MRTGPSTAALAVHPDLGDVTDLSSAVDLVLRIENEPIGFIGLEHQRERAALVRISRGDRANRARFAIPGGKDEDSAH
jgi:hypothetical protein